MSSRKPIDFFLFQEIQELSTSLQSALSEAEQLSKKLEEQKEKYEKVQVRFIYHSDMMGQCCLFWMMNGMCWTDVVSLFVLRNHVWKASHVWGFSQDLL